MAYALSDYEDGSWWVKELEGLLGAKTSSPVTPDQRRAAGVALDFARLVWADRHTLQEQSAQASVATLHDDGYWSWKKGFTPPHKSNFAGWRMDVYAAPATQQEQPSVAILKSEVESNSFANQEDLATVWRMNDDLKAEIALLKKKEQPAQEPGAHQEIEFDGYKGEHNIRWYINDLQRVRFINQWIADIYSNKLREFYQQEFRRNGKQGREVEILAQRELAGLASLAKQHASTYWPEGVKIPDLQQFESKHDAVTKELLRSISSEPPTQPALSDDRQKKV